MDISEMSNEQLASEYEGMHQLINDVGCYGTRDLRWFDTLEHEINKRGGEIHQTVKVVFEEEDEELDAEGYKNVCCRPKE